MIAKLFTKHVFINQEGKIVAVLQRQRKYNRLELETTERLITTIIYLILNLSKLPCMSKYNRLEREMANDS